MYVIGNYRFIGRCALAATFWLSTLPEPPPSIVDLRLFLIDALASVVLTTDCFIVDMVAHKFMRRRILAQKCM